MAALIKFLKQIDLTDYTLIIPSVSVGNVPQLTVDIIISTYNFARTGIIWHPAIIPSVGGDPFEENSTNVTTACELYTNEELKLALIQLRSSIEQPFAQSFFESLLKNANDLKIKTVIILTSTFAHEKHDVKASNYRCLTNLLSDEILLENDVLKGDLNELKSGTGFALKLYKMCLDLQMQTTLLAQYTSEGDNRPDAIRLLSLLSKLIKNFGDETKTVKFPISWDHVFGNPPPRGIY